MASTVKIGPKGDRHGQTHRGHSTVGVPSAPVRGAHRGMTARGVSLRGRLLLVMTALVGVSLLLADVGSVIFLRAVLTRDLERTLMIEARSVFSTWLHTGDLPIELPEGRVAAVYGPGGVLIATSGGSAPRTAPPPGESQTARELRYLIPLTDGGGILLTTGLTSVDRAVTRLEEVLLVVTGGALLVAVLLADRLAQQLARPLTRLANEAARIGETADLEAAVPVHEGIREIHELGVTWNRMLGTLRETFHALEASEGRERALRELAIHDLRTPLTTVLGTLELLGRGNLPPKEREEAVRLAEQEARRLALRIDELWASERPGPSDLVASARRAAARHQVRSEAPRLLVAAPREEVERVLQLLVDNAERHNPPGVHIEVEVGREGDEVFARVHDDGVGMDAETVAHAFERFYRGDDRGGLGLGLSLVKALTESRGGRVTLTSAPGQGTTVTVFWPLVADRAREGGG